MDIEGEITELKRRVGDLEGAVNVLAGRVGQVHPDLMALRQTTTDRFDKVEDLVGKVVGRLDDLNSQVWSLRDDLPHILSAARERGKGS